MLYVKSSIKLSNVVKLNNKLNDLSTNFFKFINYKTHCVNSHILLLTVGPVKILSIIDGCIDNGSKVT